MDYKSKYLKYKYKYQELLNKYNQNIQPNQYGGSQTTIPSSLPKTYSFLFMPLIYYAIDKDSVRLIDGFDNIVAECITNSKELMVSIGENPDSISFANFDEFITYLRFALNSNGINNLADINPLDGDHHIPGRRQEIITNYHTDQSINTIISCVAQMLVERHSGKKFEYLK